MDKIEKDSTDHEQKMNDQEGNRSTQSAEDAEKKPTDREKANEILKDVEKLVEHEPSFISGEDIEKLRKILSDLQKKIPKEEKKPPTHLQLRLEEVKLHPILKNFKVSYDNLNYQSRICLLYLSIFPEDACIKKRPIIYWWIANGLVKPVSTGEKKKTAEEVGEDIFQDLLQSHLIMPRGENEISIVNKCRIHPWIRHMLIPIARKAHLFEFNGNASSGHVCLPKDFDSKKLLDSKKQVKKGENTNSDHAGSQEDGGLKKPMESQQSSKGKTANSGHDGPQEDGNSQKPMGPQQSVEGTTANSGHVGSQEDGDSRKRVESQQSSEVRAAEKGRDYFKTIFNVGDRYLSLNPTWFADHRKLVALQLGRWQASPHHHIEVEREDLLSKALGTQSLLKYLSLRGISRITELPDLIFRLPNLEILDLKACHNLETLPADISALSKLTHLDVSECYLLDGMPKGLGKLTSLQALKGFIIAESKKTPTRIWDLKSLENLKRFSLRIGSEAEIVQGEFAGLEQLKSVQRLKISWGVVSAKKKEQVMQEDFKLPTSLEKLTLEGLPHKKFPDWLKPSKLKKLKMLYIEGGILEDLGHGESDHEWKVEILHLWYMIKTPKIDLTEEAKRWFPYLRQDPYIKRRKEGARLQESK